MPLAINCSKRETLFLIRKFYIIRTYFRLRFGVNWFWRGLIGIFNKKKPSLSSKGMAFSFLFFLFFSPKKRGKKNCLMQFPLRMGPLCVQMNFTTYSNCKITNIFPRVFFLWNLTKVSATSTNYFFGYKMAQNGHILRGREKKKWNSPHLDNRF